MTTPERALQLASSGTMQGIEDIRRQLVREGFASPGAHLAGAGFRKQLRALIGAARTAKT